MALGLAPVQVEAQPGGHEEQREQRHGQVEHGHHVRPRRRHGRDDQNDHGLGDGDEQDRARAEALAELLTGTGETVIRLGHVTEGQGVRYTGTLA